MESSQQMLHDEQSSQQIARLDQFKSDNSNSQITLNNRSFSLITLEQYSFNRNIEDIEKELFSITSHQESTKARKFYEDVYRVKNILLEKNQKFLEFLSDTKTLICQNIQQLMTIGQKIHQLQENFAIIVNENYLKLELKYAQELCNKLNNIDEKVQRFKVFTDKENELIEQNCKDLVALLPTKEENIQNCNNAKILEILENEEKQKLQYIQKRSEIESEISQIEFKIQQLEQYQQITIADEKILNNQLKNIQKDIEIQVLYINDDGEKAKNEIELQLKKLKEEEDKISLGESKFTKQQEDNFQTMRDNVQQRINKFKADYSQNISSSGSYASGLHFIFVIDESYSVKSIFTKIIDAFEIIINNRKKLGKDKVTIIQFDDNVRTTYACCSITENFKLKCRAGSGTNFTLAFKQAQHELLSSGSKYQPLLIFMTDGEADAQESQKILNEMYNNSMDNNFPLWTFCIGFKLDDRSSKTLELLAKAGNGGQSVRDIGNQTVDLNYNCKDIKQLLQTMKSIDEKIQIIDNAEVFIEQLNKRLTEVTDHQFKEQKRLQEVSFEQLKSANQKLNNLLKFQNVNKEERKKLFQENADIRSKEKRQIEEQLNQVTEQKIKRFNEITKQKQRVANLKSELQLQLFNYTEKEKHSNDYSEQTSKFQNISQLKKEFQQKGFYEDKNIYVVQFGLIKLMNETMVNRIKRSFLELQRCINIIKDDFRFLVERMEDFSETQLEEIALNQVGHQILSKNNPEHLKTQEFSSQDLRKLIEYFLKSYSYDKYQQSAKILEFFNRKISSIQDLYYDSRQKPNTGTREQDDESLTNEDIVNGFFQNEIIPFVEDVFPKQNEKYKFPILEGDFNNQTEQVEEIIKDLKEQDLYNQYFDKVQILKKQVKIAKYQEKLKKKEVKVNKEKKLNIEKKIKKLNKKIKEEQQKQENPEKKNFQEDLRRIYLDMRKDFSQEVLIDYLRYQRQRLINQYSLTYQNLKPKIVSLQQAIQHIENG